MENHARNLDDIDLMPGIAHPETLHGLAETDERYIVEVFSARDVGDDFPLLGCWEKLLLASGSPEKLYQMPRFFRYALSEEQGGSSGLALYAVRRRADNACVGILPVRKITRKIVFALGPVQFYAWKLRALQIMGSVPLLEQNEQGLTAYVLRHLLECHPDCQALSMQAVPEEKLGELGSLPALSAHIQNGLRDCHTVPLPQDFNTYLQKFSSKKRYNLSRQIRLLGEQAGEIQLCRIEEAAQVGMLVQAIRALLPQQQARDYADQARLEQLALHGILHSYVVRCGTQDVAFIYATRSDDVWHVHKIAVLSRYQGLSAGTSAVHLAMQDIISHFSFDQADFGYGTPNHEFRSTHVQKKRAFVLLCRSRSLISCLLAAHAFYQRLADRVIPLVKSAVRYLKQHMRSGAKPGKQNG